MYKKFYQKSLIAIIGILFSLSAFAQSQASYKLTGSIKSEKEETIPGVNILVDGTSGPATFE